MRDTMIKLHRSHRPSGPEYIREERILAFTVRNPRMITLAVGGTGLNFHRRGGISLTGVPRRGGTTICWGELRRKCERFDKELKQPGRSGIDAWVATTGRFMIRIGRDF